MKYNIVESVKKQTPTNIPCDDEFTLSVYNADSEIVEALKQDTEEVSEAYEYSDYDKKLLVNRANAIAKRIYELYNDAGTEANGELGSANEIAQDLLSDTAKIDMYTKFLGKVVAKKPIKNQIDKLIQEIKNFKVKFERMKPNIQECYMKVADLKESKASSRQVFYSLVELPDGSRSILNDGYFVTKVYSDTIDEAVETFKKFLKTDWKGAWKKGALNKISANEFLGESVERFVGQTLTEAEVPIRLSMDDMTNSDNFNLGAKVKKEVADENQRIADEKERQRIATLREENKEIFDIIGGSSSVEDKVEALFDTFVPSRGKSDVVIGELARALMRLRYRKWNDGDLYFIGYGIETCCNAYNYIMYNMSEWDENTFNKLSKLSSAIEKEARKFCKENEYQVLSKGWGWEELDEKYDKFLDDFSQVVLDWMYNNPDKCFVEADDMLSSEYSDETDLRNSEPRVSIEFSSGNASWELFRYVEEYGDTIGYDEYDLVRDFSDDADQWDNAEEENMYSDCVVYSVPMSEARNFNERMLDWCDAKLEDLISEYGEDPEGDEEEEEEEDEEDIDESMNETLFGKGDKGKGGPIALDPDEDSEETRKKAKEVARQAAEKAAEKARKNKKNESLSTSRKLNESSEDSAVWTSDGDYYYWAEADDATILEEFCNIEDVTEEDIKEYPLDFEDYVEVDDDDNFVDFDYDAMRERVVNIYLNGENEYEDLQGYVIPEITKQIINNCLIGVDGFSSRYGFGNRSGVIDFSENPETKITNFLYNGGSYNRGVISVDDGVVCLTDYDHDGSTSVSLYTAPSRRKLDSFIKECTTYIEEAEERREEYNDDLTLEEIAAILFQEDMDYYGFDVDELSLKNGIGWQDCIKYMTPIRWNV